jgi:hypothetical protein
MRGGSEGFHYRFAHAPVATNHLVIFQLFQHPRPPKLTERLANFPRQDRPPHFRGQDENKAKASNEQGHGKNLSGPGKGKNLAISHCGEGNHGHVKGIPEAGAFNEVVAQGTQSQHCQDQKSPQTKRKRTVGSVARPVAG